MPAQSTVNAVIFDLDGVLVRTDELHFLAWKKLADELHIPFDREANEKLRGVSRMRSLELVLGENSYSGEEKIALAERKNETYRELLKTLTPASVSPDALRTLETLKERGRKLAVGSSSKNARTILERTGLTAFFDVIVDGAMISRSKPDPEVFLRAAELLREPPARCIVVEDAEAGIDAANAGGFLSVGFASAAAYAKASVCIGALPDLLNVVFGGSDCAKR